ncbi:hypothetical protein D4R87_03380 [bacterium]|nr:MAG: hypothetical protein D4R87_03380 [bacterium]
MFLIALAGIARIIKIPVILFVLVLIAKILALWLGSYVAVKYVMKKSIIFKRDARTLAFLAVVIPLLGSIVGMILSPFDFQNLVGNLLGTILALGITYYSVKSLISKHGTD